MQGRIIDPFDAPQAQPVSQQQTPQGQGVSQQSAMGGMPSSGGGIVDPFDAPQNIQQGQASPQGGAKNIPAQQSNSTGAVSNILNNQGLVGYAADKLLKNYNPNSSTIDEIKAVPDAFIKETSGAEIGINQVLLKGLHALGAISDDTYNGAIKDFKEILHAPPMFNSQENYNNAFLGRTVGTGLGYLVPGGALKELPAALAAGGKALAEAAPNAVTKFISNVAEKPATGYIATGALANNLQYVPDDQSRLLNTIEGGLAGYGVGKAAEKVFGYLGARQAAKAAQDAASRPIEAGESAAIKTQANGQSADAIPQGSAQQAKGASSNATSKIFNEPDFQANTAAANANQSRFTREADELGIKYTKGDATQDFKQQEFESRASKMQDVGDDLRAFKDAQQQSMVGAAGKLAENVGGEADKVVAGADIQSALRAAAKQSKSEVSGSYETAKVAPGNEDIIPTDKLKNDVADILDNFNDVIPPPIISKLENYGLIGNKEDAENLTVREASKLIQSINLRAKGAKGSHAEGLRRLRNSVEDSITSLNQGDGEAANLFSQARAQRTAHANVYEQKDIVQQVIDKKARYTNHLDPQEIVDKVVKDRGSNLENIFKIKQALLRPDAKGNVSAEGQAAWDNLRGATIHDLLVGSVEGAETGTPYFNVGRFNREAEKIGDSALKMILSPKEFTDFKKFQRVVSQIRRKAPGAVNTSNTATAMINLLSNAPVIGTYLTGILKGVGRRVTKYNDIGKINEAIHGGKKPTADMVNASKEAIQKNVQETKSPILRLLSGYAGMASPNIQAPYKPTE